MTDVSDLLTPPENWQWGEFYNKHDQEIRYGMNIPKNATALIILAEGRTECIEEYFETIRDFNAKGYACAIMDWQGHGKSYRYGDDNTRQHSEGFEHDVSDFHAFITHIHIDLPKILFAHSMGGNIGLRYLADHPDTFTCAYLVAPMLGLNPKRLIKYCGRMILNFATRMHWLSRYGPGQSAWNETIAHLAKHKVSGDPVRRELQPYLFRTYPELQCGGVTWGWLKAAIDSITLLHTPDYCARITVPIFMAVAGKDVVVDNDGTLQTASLLPKCQTHVFDKAHHQIHRETDDIRDACLMSFYNFVEKS